MAPSPTRPRPFRARYNRGTGVSSVFQPASAAAGQARGRRFSARTALLLVVAAWALVYLPGLFSPPLLDDADSVHAEAAREMLLRHDWVTLHVNGVRYLEKAPLLYWTVAASFKLFGVGEWQARLPLALAALALALAAWRLARRVYGESGGLFAGLAITTALGPYVFTRFLIPDLLVGLWLLLTFDFFLRALEEERPSRASCWGMAIASALNVLTKGLIGLVFPAAVIFLYLLLTRDLKRLLRLRLLSSTLIFLAVAAPWHLLAGLRNPAQGEAPGFFWFYFVNEHFLRYLNQRLPRDYDTVPLLLFWGLMLVWVLPWSAYLPQAMVKAWRAAKRAAAWMTHAVRVAAVDAQAKRLVQKSRAQRTAPDLSRIHAPLTFWNPPQEPSAQADLVCALWALVVLVFFSFSTRQEYYVLPAVPALALLIGGWLGREAESAPDSRERRAGRRSAVALLAVGALVLLATLALALTAQTPPPGSDLAGLLSKNPEQYALSFGHIFDLTPPALGAFRVPLVGLGIALFGGTLANWLLRRRGRPLLANLALAAGAVALLWFVHVGLVTFSPVITSKPLAAAITQRWRPGDLIVIDGDYEDGSTLNFYTTHPVRILNHREANLWYGSFFPDAPRVFETNDSFLALWRGGPRVFLWSQTPHPELLAHAPVFQVARSGGKYILSNRPD